MTISEIFTVLQPEGHMVSEVVHLGIFFWGGKGLNLVGITLDVSYRECPKLVNVTFTGECLKYLFFSLGFSQCCQSIFQFHERFDGDM